jgi:branched-chain amino acid transport system permease protein
MAYIEHVLIFLCIYIILSVSLNLTIGFTGLLNLGHISFYAIGAYASALVVLKLGMPFIAGLIAASLAAALLGLLIGLPTLKLRGDYFAIATLGMFYIINAILRNWRSVTRGPLGLPGIPKPEIFNFKFNTQTEVLILSIILALFTIYIVHRLVRSPFGRILTAIREDELAVKALGKNPVKFKITALMISAALAGIAGSIYAHYLSFIDPNVGTFIDSVFIICMVVLGGMASIRGSIAGAIFLVFLPESLRFLSLPNEILGALRLLIFSLILILLMMYKPNGIFGEQRLKVHQNA